jgi:uncharacterized membrane protein YvlD (DUF360 family)
MSLLISWFVLTFSFVVASNLIDGFQLKGGLGNQLKVAAVFAILNLFFGWLCFLLVGIGTFGLGFVFSFVGRLFATALVLKMTDAVTDKLRVKTYGAAFLGAFVMSVTGAATEFVLHHIGIG